MSMRLFLYLLCVVTYLITPQELLASEKNARPITLQEASEASGLLRGSQESIKKGIDLQQYSLGFESAFTHEPSPQTVDTAIMTDGQFPLKHSNSGEEKKFSDAELQAASYQLGLLAAMDAKSQLIELDVMAYMKGFKKGYLGHISVKKQSQYYLTVTRYSEQERNKNNQDRLVASQLFLQENARKSGIKTTKSGVQYEILEEGAGAVPNWNDLVKVNHYQSTPSRDFHYDSSEQGGPEVFPVNGAIPKAWSEIFSLMKVGSRIRVYVPPALGFVGRLENNWVLPNEILISEFTLIDIIHPQTVAR